METTLADASLGQALLESANGSGGWGYYNGKASRLEPTCWALLALGARGSASAGLSPRGSSIAGLAPRGSSIAGLADLAGLAGLAAHSQFLTRCQQPSGWLVEDRHWPVNIGFNAVAAFTWFARPELATDDSRRRVVAALVTSKGVQAPRSENLGQDNSLQGWPWIDSTFSWVEPTSWGLVALKKARRAGVTSQAADARIHEAERLLMDRSCRTGGWNFGNASVMHQDLRAYVPTTALGLLALQDRRDDAAVVQSLAYLEDHWSDEVSATAMGLSITCLDVYGRPVERIQARLKAHAEQARAFGNLHGDALALFALSGIGEANVFRL